MTGSRPVLPLISENGLVNVLEQVGVNPFTLIPCNMNVSENAGGWPDGHSANPLKLEW